MAFHSLSHSHSLSHLRSHLHDRHRLRPAALAAALCLSAAAASAQSQDPAVQTITVVGRNSSNVAGVSGFGDLAVSRLPLSATVIQLGQLEDAGISGLGDLTRLDAGTTDAYNPPGYWSQLAVRGFTLDNRFNYRRDGLPINAETVIPLANKQSLELLKGSSGIQAGTSAPGGLLNLVVKRPEGRIRSVTLDAAQSNTFGVAVDLGDRAGADGALGWRVNASYEHLDPTMHNSRGHSQMAAVAVDARLGAGRRLEVEFEASRQSQPSTPGFSLLGDRIPDAQDVDPRTNLNNQSWSLPVVMDGQTASLRYTEPLANDVDLVVHAQQQRLRTDDRIAFPFGYFDPETYDCDPCDRYTRDGRFSFWDFRSEDERRTSDALDLSVKGRFQGLGGQHRFHAGVLFSRYKARFQRQAYNLVGVGTVDGLSVVPEDPTLSDENTQRDERSTELHLQDALALNARWSVWAGLRHTRLERQSVRTDGSRPTRYEQSFTTPWLALSRTVGAKGLAYASWGQGIESEVVPNKPSSYINAGETLPALKSRQFEVGYKHRGSRFIWSVAAFDIERPAWRDFDELRQIDGRSRHRGVELEAEWRAGVWNLRASALALQARREASVDPALNGLRPTNVPERSLKLQAAYNVASIPGLALLGFMTYESDRMVLPDNSLATPGWTRIDAGARYTHVVAGHPWVWRLGVDNLANRRAWKEVPYQYEHAYLYPMAPRTMHASLQMGF
jgi:iron complex outermembrane recepter protein